MTYVSTVDILIRRPESLCVVENCASNSRPLITSRMTYPKPHIHSPHIIVVDVLILLSLLYSQFLRVMSHWSAPEALLQVRLGPTIENLQRVNTNKKTG